MRQYRLFYHRHLPHWQPAGATLFVTFRLAGSLPRFLINELETIGRQREAALSRIEEPIERSKESDVEARRAFGRWDAALDRDQGQSRWLAIPEAAEIVSQALHYRHGRVYGLEAFCIMPNHVHLVCTPLRQDSGAYYPLHRILQSLKRYTARQANLVLGRQGAFWQGESYDHVVRDDEELERVLAYVINNPVKAGLASDAWAWPWTYLHPTYAAGF